MKMVLYALKCDGGYIKAEENSLKIVDMQKASVFINAFDLNPVLERVSRASGIEGVHPVELTIIERNIEVSMLQAQHCSKSQKVN